MPAQPLISVCIPAYNADKYIREALASVRAQALTDWEVIVTEDGTKDRTEEWVAEFAKTVRQPVIYNRHELNRGLPHARNTGIAASRSRWVAFLDADDFWEPNHLESLVAKAEAAPCDVVFAGSKMFDDASGQIVGVRAPSEEQLGALPHALFMGWLSVMPSSVMIRRDAFERFGLVSVDFRRVNDTEYWLRVLRKGGVVSYSGANTCVYRVHNGSLTQKAAVGQFVDSARLCELYAGWDLIPRSSRRSRPANLYRWAANLTLKKNPREAVELLKESLRIQPLNTKTLLCFVRALLLSRLPSAKLHRSAQSA